MENLYELGNIKQAATILEYGIPCSTLVLRTPILADTMRMQVGCRPNAPPIVRDQRNSHST